MRQKVALGSVVPGWDLRRHRRGLVRVRPGTAAPLPPGSLAGPPALTPILPSSQCTNPPLCSHMLTKTRAHAQPRTDTQAPALYPPFTYSWALGSGSASILSGLRHLPSPLWALVSSFPKWHVVGPDFPRPHLTWTCMCLPAYHSATCRLSGNPHLSSLHALPSPDPESPGP